MTLGRGTHSLRLKPAPDTPTASDDLDFYHVSMIEFPRDTAQLEKGQAGHRIIQQRQARFVILVRRWPTLAHAANKDRCVGRSRSSRSSHLHKSCLYTYGRRLGDLNLMN